MRGAGSIITQRCTLDPLTTSEAVELHALWTSPQVRKYLWDDEEIAFAKTQEILSKSVDHLDRLEYGLWGVHLHDEAALAGFGGYWPFHEPTRIELLFGLDPRYWGHGYATEIARALIDVGRETFSFEPILASTDAPNVASMAVLERLGMRLTELHDETGTCFFELAR